MLQRSQTRQSVWCRACPQDMLSAFVAKGGPHAGPRANVTACPTCSRRQGPVLSCARCQPSAPLSNRASQAGGFGKLVEHFPNRDHWTHPGSRRQGKHEMTNSMTHAFTPDFASPPGHLIQEYLEELGISARELARRCGRSGKLMAEITAGKAPIEPETALQLERVLDVPAAIWINMEAAYQLHRAWVIENEALESCYKWANSFPLKDLAERKYIARPQAKSEQVRELLKFFGVGSVKACEDRMAELLAVHFRTSEKFTNDTLSLAAWIRIGERRAAEAEALDYDRDAFLGALKDIRDLTTVTLDKAMPEIEKKCAAAGVIFVLEKPLPKMRASGVSRWLSPRRALIQQSLRHKSDDHFWFTFFHECAHILLHSRKEVFIDMVKGPGSADPRQEAEANAWAADFLVPVEKMRAFVSTFGGSEAEVRQFANSLGIAPGIIVGQLQHSRVIGFSKLNGLRQFYEWTD